MSAPRELPSWIALACGLILLGTGCGPSRVLDAPGHWPRKWHGMDLYNTPQAIIYANGSVAAGEADRVVDKVARDFTRAGGTATKGLVIISARPEELIVNEPHQWYALMMHSESGGTAFTDEQIARRWEAIRSSLAGQGIDPATELQVRSLALTPDVVVDRLEFPRAATDEVAWVVAMPTQSLIHSGSKQMMNDKIAARGTGPVAVVATAPLLLVEEQRMINNAVVNRDLQVFEAMGAADVVWASGPGAEQMQIYAQRKVDEAMLPILSTLRDVALEVGHSVGNVVAGPRTATEQDAGSAPQE